MNGLFASFVLAVIGFIGVCCMCMDKYGPMSRWEKVLLSTFGLFLLPLVLRLLIAAVLS